MRLSELRAHLDAIEAEHGDVDVAVEVAREFGDELQVYPFANGSGPITALISDEPPFAPELADVDRATTGEPDHLGPPVIDAPTPLHLVD